MAREECFRFCAGAKVKDDIYFSNYQYNALYVLKRDCAIPQYVTKFPGENMDAVMLHKTCIKASDYLIFIPEIAANIHIYNLITREMIAINVKRYQHVVGPISEAVIINNEIVAFPASFIDPVRIISLDKFELVEDWDFSNWAREHISSVEDIDIARFALWNNLIWVTPFNSNMLIRIDWLSKQFQTIIGPFRDSFGAFSGDSGIWILSNTSDEIYMYDPGKEQFEKYDKLHDYRRRPFNHLIEIDRKLILLPAYEDNIVCLELISKNRNILELDITRIELNSVCFFGYSMDNDELILFPFNTEYVIELRTNSISKIVRIGKDIYDYNKVPYSDFFLETAMETINLGICDLINFINK